MSGIPSRIQQPGAFGGSPRKSGTANEAAAATSDTKLPSPSMGSRTAASVGIPLPSASISSAATAPGTGRRSLPAPSSWHNRGTSDEDRMDTPSRLRHPQMAASIAPSGAGKSDSPLPYKAGASVGTGLPRTPAARRSLAPKSSFGASIGARTPGFGASTSSDTPIPPAR